MNRLVFLVIFCTLLPVALSSDSIGAGTAADPAYYFGPTDYLGNGGFRAYIAIDHEQEVPVSFGSEISKSFFIDPPLTDGDGHGHFTVYLTLPDITGVYTPIQSFEVNWTPEGHPGTPFPSPHFDWHLYFMNVPAREAEILTGTCAEGVSAEALCRALRPIPAPCCPPLYIAPRITVPAMGNHLLDLLDTALTEGKFQNSMLMGGWDGRVIFYEPMVITPIVEAIANGTTTTPVCRPIRNPSRMATAGYYPSQFCLYSTVNNVRAEFNQFIFVEGGCGTVEEFGAATCAYDPSGDASITMNDVKNCNNCPYYKYTKEMANDK